jgi:hypothetical protein
LKGEVRLHLELFPADESIYMQGEAGKYNERSWVDLAHIEISAFPRCPAELITRLSSFDFATNTPLLTSAINLVLGSTMASRPPLSTSRRENMAMKGIQDGADLDAKLNKALASLAGERRKRAEVEGVLEVLRRDKGESRLAIAWYSYNM